MTNKLSRLIITATFFCTGFFAIIIQTVMFRELLVVVLGNEIIIGISLFNWLTGVSLGAIFGSVRVKQTSGMVRTFSLSLLFMMLYSQLAITCIRLLYQVSHTPAGVHLNFFKVFYLSGACIIPVSFIIGFTFPFASKFSAHARSRFLQNVSFISGVYIVESLGSLLGGIAASFFLVEHLNSYAILSLVSLPLIIMLCFLIRRSRHTRLFFLAAVFGILCLITLFPRINRMINHFTILERWKGFSSAQLVWNRDSRYQNLMLGKSHDQYNLYSNGQFSTSFPEETDNRILSAHLFCQHPGPQHILIIGEAISGLARHLLDYDIKTLKTIELDEKTVEGISHHLSAENKAFMSDPRFAIRIGDGRRIIREKSRFKAAWDIVFINMGEPSTLLLNRYYTLEFFRDVSAILAADGVLSLRITSSENYGSGFVSRYTSSIYQTLKRVFPHIAIAPGDRNLFFATRSPDSVSISPQVLAGRYRKAGTQPARLGLIFESLYPREKTAFISSSLQNQNNQSINTDGKPLSLFYFNQILGWTSNGKTESFFLFFERLHPDRVFIVILALLLLRWLWIPIKKSLHPRFDIRISVLIAGFSGLSLEILIIYSVQNITGYIYQLIGFIIALFMTGLPLGAYLSKKWLRQKQPRRSRQFRWLALIQLFFLILALIFPKVLNEITRMGLIGNILLFCLVALDGILVGALFPVALNLHIQKADDPAVSAGIIDAMDHLGAAFGALLTGALLLPVLGISGTTGLIAALSALSIILLAPYILFAREP
jgi:predicted membrane-bound spermidine synthase